MKYIVYPFALIYGIIISIRNIFFDVGILRSEKFPLWVISIGNLSVGGTGKSPHTEYIANLLEGIDKEKFSFNNIATLSRGYGRNTNGFRLVNESDNAKEVGDEPLQLKKRLKDVYVAVDENRAHGIKTLLELNPQLKLTILDDAFQHRYVKRDVSILLTSYYQPFYNDSVLPTGRLREPRRGYRRANIIIVTNTPPNISVKEKETIVKKINPRRKQKVFFSNVIYQSLAPVYICNDKVPVINKTYSILLFTGIANAQGLYNHLTEIARDVNHISFPDHYIFQPSDISKIIKHYNNITNPNKLIVTTEKDAMRLYANDLSSQFKNIPVYYLPIQVKVNEEEELKSILTNYLYL